jgi:hypothetical protein
MLSTWAEDVKVDGGLEGRKRRISRKFCRSFLAEWFLFPVDPRSCGWTMSPVRGAIARQSG